MSVILGILGTFLQILGIILFKFYAWVLIVAVLVYLIWQNRRRLEWVSQTEHILLLIEVPKDNDKKELSAEQMFASLHGILRPKGELRSEGSLQEHISFEIASIGNRIQFYVWCPTHLKDFVEGQIYAQYPSVRIREGVGDYAATEAGDRAVYSAELTLTKDEVLPIKTFQTFEVDPLAGITAVLAKLHEPNEEMWIQILARPEEDTWQDKGLKYIEEIKQGKTPTLRKQLGDQLLQLPIYIAINFVNALFAAPEVKKEEKKEKKELSTGQKTMTSAIEAKIAKLGYQVKIRINYLGPTEALGKQRMQAIVGAFKQYNTTMLNGFTPTSYKSSTDALQEYRARLFLGDGYTLNIEELASVYHLPHTSVETPNMNWATTKTSEPPPNLPTMEIAGEGGISLFAMTNYRGEQKKFGIKRSDRGRHLYIVGQTGAGKSGTLNLLALSDIYHDQGFAIVDPHGDFATDILKYIPEHRLNDVVYFNPTDREYPIAFNPLEVTDSAFKNDLSSELIGVLKRMFDSWGPRLEYILRYTILALLDYPDSTMLGITRMLTDKDFRKKVIREIKDPVVKAFWVTEFASWNDKFANEAVAPVLNKVGAFVANPLIRNIIGQPKSTIDLRRMMDEGKILIVNLSRGQIGEDNAAILGALMVTKIQLAAMTRANIALENRRPFYLYVDEFQNFATDSFAVILSEARKYGLYLTVANQYISQMPETVRDAVFGNVGSMISFRVGATDSTILGKYFEPSFEAPDLVKLDNRDAVINMIIDGNKSIPFSARTIELPPPEHDHTAQIVKLTRSNYSFHRDKVEDDISRWTLGSGELGQNKPTEATSVSALPNLDDEQKPNILSDLKNPTHIRPVPSHTNSTSSRSHSGSSANRGRSGDNRGGHAPQRDQHRPSGGGNRSSSTRTPASVGGRSAHAHGQPARQVQSDQTVTLRSNSDRS